MILHHDTYVTVMIGTWQFTYDQVYSVIGFAADALAPCLTKSSAGTTNIFSDVLKMILCLKGGELFVKSDTRQHAHRKAQTKMLYFQYNFTESISSWANW